MGQRVLILLPGVGTLALEEETYRLALEEGSRFNLRSESSEDPNERLLDSKQLADALQVPVTWIEQQHSITSIRPQAPVPPISR
jgi:hypothetical protein